ncbi:unnamed protein product [[Actinomadura] parvosata subsp. kistnae]|uniref:Uncharacterized protein n=1 Tax=[Actinomadura] parvosata subsp. kistnae TaxID=1909395 RepID=A0A1U9ZYJ9_9ACTN|nr:hypothetical protein [Nonomuraea sp. ATCC 55076]AQZ63028.1 hypothetical protein BKM31_17560 [Nonomuraea sp. ATCC 55076]SPL99950.1 unnamed protein product [Actinomadura parvosata subsp. kistnae]
MVLINEKDTAADAMGKNYAERLQRRLPDWWVMYSLRDRALVAFYAGHCAPGGIWVAAEHPDELLRRMSDAVQAQWRSQAAYDLRNRPLAHQEVGRFC